MSQGRVVVGYIKDRNIGKQSSTVQKMEHLKWVEILAYVGAIILTLGTINGNWETNGNVAIKIWNLINDATKFWNFLRGNRQ